MPLKVALQDIWGKKEKEITPEGWLLNEMLPIDDPRFPLLQYVDPYGNTVFNGKQMSAVIGELNRLVEETSSTEGKTILAEIRELAVNCRDHPQKFVRFIGD